MEHKEYVKVNFGTKVTRSILNSLGSPDDCLKIIHIAGTNGKGSTAEFFTRILVSAGKRTGTFTSPAVYDFYDQFKIDGKKMDNAEKYFEAAARAAEGLNATDFEIQTAGIIYAFKCEGCEYAVIECGMGGLGDATNAINRKELAVITSISKEHTAYLGNTLKEICAQKAGIIKNCPVVVNCNQTDEVKRYFKKYNAVFPEPYQTSGCRGNEFMYGKKKFALAVTLGSVQRFNAATAIEGARILKIDEDAIYEGISQTKPEGRIQFFKALGKTYILDGAHNPAAYAPLVEKLKETDGKPTIIFGCLKDKDIDGILAQLAKLTDEITAIECRSARALSLRETVAACRRVFAKVNNFESVTKAMESAAGERVVVCGSFTLLNEAKQWIEAKR